jgi:hypothetical protein
MNHFKLTITLLLFLASFAVNPSMAFSLTSQESDAETALMRYFDALSQGDIRTLRSLMAGDLLAKRASLLDNPTYPPFLAKTYGNAHFQIDAVNTLNPSTIEIQATIVFDQDNSSQRHYLLREKTSGSGFPAFYIIKDAPPDGR